MAVPIIVIQRGNSDYLKYCLYQAKYSNPQSQIILIGDRSNNKYPFVRHYHITGYSFNANLFEKTYLQLKMHSNWHVKMIKKWFVLRDFIRGHNYGDRFVYIDSDVLLYCDVTAEFENFKDYAMTIGIEGAPYCIFFNSNATLEELCDFISNIFKDPDEKQILSDKYNGNKTESSEKDIIGSTMILEYKKMHPGKIGDNSIILNGSTYASNHFKAHGFEFDEKNHEKKIYWKNGYPYGRRIEDGELIKFNAIHFAGHAKSVMHRYYTGKNLQLQKFISEMYKRLSLNRKESRKKYSVKSTSRA